MMVINTQPAPSKFTTPVKFVAFRVNDYCSITFKAPCRITPNVMPVINRAISVLSLIGFREEGKR